MPEQYELAALYKKDGLKILGLLVQSDAPLKFNELNRSYNNPATLMRRLKELIEARMVVRGIKIKSEDYQVAKDVIIISTTKSPELGYLATEYGKKAFELVEGMETRAKKLKKSQS